MKVLIANDSSSVRRALGRVLSAQGFEVVAARSDEEAWERFAALAPELTIADVSLPGSGGLELCRRLRERAPRIPVILLSGVGDAHIEQQAQAVGAAAVIPKPFSPEDLSAALEAALNLSLNLSTPALQDVMEPAAKPPRNAERQATLQDPDLQNPDLPALLTRFLEKPGVSAATLSDRQGICLAHVGEHPTDAPTLAAYSRFLLIASDVLGVHFGAEHTDGMVLEFPRHTLYLGRVDEAHILGLYLSDAEALSVVRQLIRKTLPSLAAALPDAAAAKVPPD